MMDASVYNYALSAEQIIGNPIGEFDGRAQVMERGLFVNVKQYMDKSEAFTWVPTFLAGCSFVQTKAREKDTAVLFRLKRPATVYVAYDAAAKVLPSWLKDFRPTGKILKNTANAIYHIYKKSYARGTVSHGTCEANLNMYTVIIGPEA
jgi:hypothetical protein